MLLIKAATHLEQNRREPEHQRLTAVKAILKDNGIAICVLGIAGFG